jgi:type IV pilus assembly protein PilV
MSVKMRTIEDWARISRRSHAAASSSRPPSGIVLIDVMIAILLFSIGILGMVALQSSAIKLSSDANYRTNAAMFADQVISNMWTADPSKLATAYPSPSGSAFKAWAATINCDSTTRATGCLPGTVANVPTITVTPLTGLASNYLVTVKVNWRAPNDTGPHNYVSTTQIGP